MLPVAMAWSSSEGSAILYVLPALSMTSGFHTMEPMGQNKGRHYVSLSLPVVALVRCQTTLSLIEFDRRQKQGANMLSMTARFVFNGLL